MGDVARGRLLWLAARVIGCRRRSLGAFLLLSVHPLQSSLLLLLSLHLLIAAKVPLPERRGRLLVVDRAGAATWPPIDARLDARVEDVSLSFLRRRVEGRRVVPLHGAVNPAVLVCVILAFFAGEGHLVLLPALEVEVELLAVAIIVDKPTEGRSVRRVFLGLSLPRPLLLHRLFFAPISSFLVLLPLAPLLLLRLRCQQDGLLCIRIGVPLQGIAALRLLEQLRPLCLLLAGSHASAVAHGLILVLKRALAEVEIVDLDDVLLVWVNAVADCDCLGLGGRGR